MQRSQKVPCFGFFPRMMAESSLDMPIHTDRYIYPAIALAHNLRHINPQPLIRAFLASTA